MTKRRKNVLGGIVCLILGLILLRFDNTPAKILTICYFLSSLAYLIFAVRNTDI